MWKTKPTIYSHDWKVFCHKNIRLHYMVELIRGQFCNGDVSLTGYTKISLRTDKVLLHNIWKCRPAILLLSDTQYAYTYELLKRCNALWCKSWRLFCRRVHALENLPTIFQCPYEPFSSSFVSLCFLSSGTGHPLLSSHLKL